MGRLAMVMLSQATTPAFFRAVGPTVKGEVLIQRVRAWTEEKEVQR